MLDFFKSFAVNPDDLPDIVFAAIGRTVWRDIGATTVSFRLVRSASCAFQCLFIQLLSAETQVVWNRCLLRQPSQ